MDNSRTIFTSLVGSHNYNLNTPGSDEDKKSFVAPTFDCLYGANLIKPESYHKQLKADLDIEFHDIRKLESVFYKANTSFLEILFSENIEINSYYEEEMEELLNLRKNIAKMNLPYLYESSVGIFFSRKKLMTKRTDNNSHLIDKYGYDPKQALHCFRALDFLKRFQNTGFNDFKDAIYYKDKDPMREYLFKIRNGEMSLEYLESMLERKLAVTEMYCKKAYRERTFDEVTNQKLINTIKKIVKKSLKREFNENMNCNFCDHSFLDDGPGGSYAMICNHKDSKYMRKAVGYNNVCSLFELL